MLLVDGPEQRERHVDAFAERWPGRLKELDDAYHRLVPRPGALEAMFRERLAARPIDFTAVATP